jgi:hypothetical protein
VQVVLSNGCGYVLSRSDHFFDAQTELIHALAEDESHGQAAVGRGTQEIELPLVDVELTEKSSNSQLIEDYWYWFWNWRFDPKI